MAQSTRYHEPFFWHRIVNVGWATGGVVIVQVTAPETKFYQVQVLDPEDWFDDNFGGSTITVDDYKEAFVLNLGTSTGVGTVVVEDAISDIWVWEGRLIMSLTDDPEDVAAAVALGTSMFGHAPNIHLVGQQVQRNRQNPAFGPYLDFNVVSHIHPNGTTTTYRQGYTALDRGPQYIDDQPFGDFDYSSSDSYYWYHTTTRPQSTAAILRRSFLVNFRKDFATLAELQDFPILLESPLEWSIKGYPDRTEFTIADSIVTPIGGVAPKFSAAGSVAGSHSGTIRRFNASGFVGG